MATLTVYSGTDDNYAGRASVNESFATIRAGAGTVAGTASAVNMFSGYLSSSSTSNQYDELYRGFYTFNTSALTSSASISSAIFSATWFNMLNGLGTGTIHVAGATKASANTVASSDFSSVLRTSFGSIAGGTMNGTLKDVTFDSNGIAYINKTGSTELSTQLSWDINNSAPTWSSNSTTWIDTYSADQSGTSSDPKLTITYDTASANTSNFFQLF